MLVYLILGLYFRTTISYNESLESFRTYVEVRQIRSTRYLIKLDYAHYCYVFAGNNYDIFYIAVGSST